MPIEKSEIIKEIEEMKFKGEYFKALDKIDAILQDESFSRIEKIQASILKCEIAGWISILFGYNLPKLMEAKNSIDLALVQAEKEGNMLLLLETHWWKTVYLWNTRMYKEFYEDIPKFEALFQKLETDKTYNLREKQAYSLFINAFNGYYEAVYQKNISWDYQESIDNLEKAYTIAKEFEDKEIMMNALFNLTWGYTHAGNYEKSLEVNKEFLRIAEELGNKYFTAFQLQRIAQDYWLMGDYDNLLHYTKKSMDIREKLGNEKFLSVSYGYLGFYYGSIGDYKEGLEHLLKANNLYTEKGKVADEPGFLDDIALFYYVLGEVDKSLECWEKLYEILKKTKQVHYEESSYFALGKMADIYFHKGEVDKALKLKEKVLDLYKRTGKKRMIAENLQSISKIYDKKGIFDKSVKFLDEALEIYLELDNKVWIAGIYFDYIILASKYDKLDLAKEYFEKLELIIEEIDQKNIKRLVLFAEGIILKNSIEAQDRVRAEVLFDQLLQENIGYYLKIEIMLQLSELLLSELKKTSNERYLAKLQKTVTNLLEIGKENNFPLIIVECLWYKSQLSLLELDVKSAQEQLTKALEIAENKGLNTLALKITKSKEQIIKQNIELEKLGDSAPISKRMEIIRVENGFKELKNKEIFEFSIEKVESTGKLFSLKI
ncbi:MAG: tetratricopeptide repeat protein [Candidatus Thorarchaeota archaeon]